MLIRDILENDRDVMNVAIIRRALGRIPSYQFAEGPGQMPPVLCSGRWEKMCSFLAGEDVQAGALPGRGLQPFPANVGFMIVTSADIFVHLLQYLQCMLCYLFFLLTLGLFSIIQFDIPLSSL